MEKLFKELSEFARQNRKALKDAEQWLNNFNGTFVRAWRCAITNWDWQKVVVVAKFAFDKGPEFLSNTILSGEYSGECHPSLDLIHNALDEGKRAQEAILPNDAIRIYVAIQKFRVSRVTIKRAIKKGIIKSYRPPNTPKNSPHIVSESELERHYQRWE